MKDLESAVNIYIAEINNVFCVNYTSGENETKVKAVYAKNYVKIIKASFNVETGEELDMTASVYCFVVKNEHDSKYNVGDILKPAGWKAPARNFIRGNVFTVDYFPINPWGM